MTAPTYHLSSIADLLDVPADRREACLRDLLTVLELQEFVFGDDAKAAVVMPMDWTDDGSPDVCLTDGRGNPLITLAIKEGGAA